MSTKAALHVRGRNIVVSETYSLLNETALIIACSCKCPNRSYMRMESASVPASNPPHYSNEVPFQSLSREQVWCFTAKTVTLAKLPAAFQYKKCFKSCCRMAMCSATCQPTRIPRPMGEPLVKNSGFFGVYSQSNPPH